MGGWFSSSISGVSLALYEIPEDIDIYHVKALSACTDNIARVFRKKHGFH